MTKREFSVCIKDCVIIKIWVDNISPAFSLMQTLLDIFSSFDLRDDKHMLYQINFYTYVCVCLMYFLGLRMLFYYNIPYRNYILPGRKL